MSKVAICPTCGSKAKVKKQNDNIIYQAIQDEEAFKKVGQMKKAMQKFKEKVEALEKELRQYKVQ